MPNPVFNTLVDALPGISILIIPITNDTLSKSHSISPSGNEVLVSFLQQQRRTPDKVLRDRNFLFNALSQYLIAVQHHHLELRKTITQFEANNQVLFSSLHMAINQTGTFHWASRNLVLHMEYNCWTHVCSFTLPAWCLIIHSNWQVQARSPSWLLHTPKLLSIETSRYPFDQLVLNWIDPCFLLSLRQHQTFGRKSAFSAYTARRQPSTHPSYCLQTLFES